MSQAVLTLTAGPVPTDVVVTVGRRTQQRVAQGRASSSGWSSGSIPGFPYQGDVAGLDGVGLEQPRVRADLPRGRVDRHPLSRRARRSDADSVMAHAGRRAQAMSRIAVVTSSPPMVEGGHMVIARSLVQALRDGRSRRRSRRHAAEPLRTSGVGVCRDLAHRCRLERRTADRSGHQPALSELRRAPSAPRVLAEPHDARVLRSVGPVSAAR